MAKGKKNNNKKNKKQSKPPQVVPAGAPVEAPVTALPSTVIDVEAPAQEVLETNVLDQIDWKQIQEDDDAPQTTRNYNLEPSIGQVPGSTDGPDSVHEANEAPRDPYIPADPVTEAQNAEPSFAPEELTVPAATHSPVSELDGLGEAITPAEYKQADDFFDDIASSPKSQAQESHHHHHHHHPLSHDPVHIANVEVSNAESMKEPIELDIGIDFEADTERVVDLTPNVINELAEDSLYSESQSLEAPKGTFPAPDLVQEVLGPIDDDNLNINTAESVDKDVQPPQVSVQESPAQKLIEDDFFANEIEDASDKLRGTEEDNFFDEIDAQPSDPTPAPGSPDFFDEVETVQDEAVITGSVSDSSNRIDAPSADPVDKANSELSTPNDFYDRVPEAATTADDEFFAQVSSPLQSEDHDDFFAQINSPVKKIDLQETATNEETAATAPIAPLEQNSGAVAPSLKLKFDDDDEFLESDDEPQAQPADVVTASVASKSLAFLEGDDDLLSDEEDVPQDKTYELPAQITAPVRQVKPSPSLHFDTGKRGFDLPTELMSKKKPQTRAPIVVRPPGQAQTPQPPVVSPYARTQTSTAPPPVARQGQQPTTPINPYATLPQPPVDNSPKASVPTAPSHILTNGPSPYSTVPGIATVGKSPYAPVSAMQSAPSKYVPPTAQPAGFPATGRPAPPTAPVPPASTAHTDKTAKKSYSRSNNPDPYGFPELKTAVPAPRSRQSSAKLQAKFNSLEPSNIATPTVTDFNTSYEEVLSQQSQVPPSLRAINQPSHQAPPVGHQSLQQAPHLAQNYEQVPQLATHQYHEYAQQSHERVQQYDPRQTPQASQVPQVPHQAQHVYASAPSQQAYAPPQASEEISSTDTLMAAPAKANPYAPNASRSGRETPLRPPTNFKSPPGTIGSATSSTPGESPYRDLHLSRPPSELAHAPPPQVPQQHHTPLHAALRVGSSVYDQGVEVVNNSINGRSNDDRLSRQIPVFTWSKQSIVTAFPPAISYGAQNVGTLVDIKPIKSLSLLDEKVSKYPGPLVNSKGIIKNKRKELEKWIVDMTETTQEHKLLWSFMNILVKELPEKEERDEILNVLDPDILAAAHPAQLKSAADLFETSKKLSGHSRQGSTQLQGIFDEIQGGNRDSALQAAIGQQEWAHALILAYSEGTETWDATVKEFVRLELRSQQSASSQQLAFAYRVFAGSGASAVDELRPLRSADSKDGQANSSGLDANLANWKKYVSIIMANRSKNDNETLYRLSEVLSERNMIEASHICALLSEKAEFGTSSMPLLGVKEPTAHNLSSLLLSEVYEYVLLARKTISLPVASLVPYKASLGGLFADCGYIAEAARYSEAALVLARALRVPEIIHICENLSQRCSAIDNGNWISRKLSRPRLDKMWVTSSFNKFVSGDAIEEEDQQRGGPVDRPSSTGPNMYAVPRQSFTPGPGGMAPLAETRSSTPGAYDYRMTSPKLPLPAQSPGLDDISRYGGASNQYSAQQATSGGYQPPMSRNHSMPYPDDFTPQGQLAPQNQYAPLNQFAPQLPVQSQYAPQPPNLNQYAPQYAPVPISQPSDPYAPFSQATSAPEPEAEAEPEEKAKKGENKENKKDDKAKESNSDKKGWFGSWFGKGDGTNKDGTKVHKAKLGEENTFYFDEKLGKWVNKNGPQPEESQAAPPPPKKKLSAPVIPAPTSMPAPTSAPRVDTISIDASVSESSSPTTGLGAPVQGDAPSSANGPPKPSAPSKSGPRPVARGSIDALLGGDGPPTAGSGSGSRKKRNARNRYVDVTQT